MIKKPRIHQMTIADFERMFPDEDACKAYLTGQRWPDGVSCPRCGHGNVYELPSRDFHWQCHNCGDQGYRFSVLVGTIFENTNKALRDWFRVIHLMLTSKKGISALQVMRYMGFGSYKTAWYMCHRVRAGLQDREFRKLVGIVEVDETYVGGKAKNRHKNKRGPDGRGTGGGIGSGKIPVVGALGRKGNVVARVLNDIRRDTMTAFVRETVSRKVSLLCTDSLSSYANLYKDFPQHEAVNHEAGQYVVGAIHTNTIEGFWSLIKRSIVGTYHKVSRKYLPLYVAERSFVYNNRTNADIFGTAVRGC